MTFRWDDYHTLATTLVGQRVSLGTEEACLRSAISRAYYAAFAAARNLGRDRNWQNFTLTGAGSDHAQVKDYYKRQPDQRYRKIGVNLERLRADRGKADYDDTLAGSLLAKAQQCLQLSGEVLAALHSI